MLRTTISTLSTRGATRFLSALRPNLTTTPPLHSLTQRTFSNSRISTKSTPSKYFTSTFNSRPPPRATSPRTIFQRLRSSTRFFTSSKARLNSKPTSPDVTQKLGSRGGASAEPTTLMGRLKKLSREYGWSVTGVYLALSILDFPFCFLLVRTVGTDRVGHWEHVVVSFFKGLVPDAIEQKWREWRVAVKKEELTVMGDDDISTSIEMVGWGVEEATAANKKDASLATQLALAYAIHKSFIFIRVPLTVAVTPKVVKVLRSWGWDIGKRTTKEAKALKRAANLSNPR